MNPDQLQYERFYHIYTHAVGGRNIFKEARNYEHFLDLFDKYVTPIANIYAWVLMPNHVHFLVKIKSEKEIQELNTSDRGSDPTSDRVQNPVRVKVQNPVRVKIGTPSQQFSKLFNAYAQGYNKWIKTRGPLFERPFKRKKVGNIQYLQKLVMYIHNNPIHHGFCKHPIEYAWSSYLSCISAKHTKLERNKVIGWFDSEANFKTMHDNKIDFKDLKEFAF